MGAWAMEDDSGRSIVLRLLAELARDLQCFTVCPTFPDGANGLVSNGPHIQCHSCRQDHHRRCDRAMLSFFLGRCTGLCTCHPVYFPSLNLPYADRVSDRGCEVVVRYSDGLDWLVGAFVGRCPSERLYVATDGPRRRVDLPEAC